MAYTHANCGNAVAVGSSMKFLKNTGSHVD